MIIRRCIEPEVLLEAAQRQLESIGIKGNIDILKKIEDRCKQVLEAVIFLVKRDKS